MLLLLLGCPLTFQHIKLDSSPSIPPLNLPFISTLVFCMAFKSFISFPYWYSFHHFLLICCDRCSPSFIFMIVVSLPPLIVTATSRVTTFFRCISYPVSFSRFSSIELKNLEAKKKNRRELEQKRKNPKIEDSIRV